MASKWKEFLTSDPQGKIWWDNLEFDLSQENLSPDIHDRFLSAIEQLIETNEGDTLPVDVIVNALREPPALFSLQGPPKPDTEPLSRVVDAASFADFYIEMRLGIDGGETRKDQIWKMFKNGDIVPERHFKRDAKLKSDRNLFWGTPTRCLESLCGTHEIRPNEYAVHPPEKADSVATEIRNLLGLNLINQGVGLYRLDIPIELLRNVKICVPTTLDSSPRCVFLPVDRTTRYGWTLHLHRLEPGVEEVVIEPIEFTKDFKVTQIGFVQEPLPDEQTVWKAVGDIVENRHPKPKVVKNRQPKRKLRKDH